MKAALLDDSERVLKILPRRDKEDEQREDREQVVQPGIVTKVTDFPAHCLFPP
jgi:hypothetical protein